MVLLDKLRKRAKELDAKVKLSLTSGNYDFQSGDDRDLLEAAVNALQAAEAKDFVLQVGVKAFAERIDRLQKSSERMEDILNG